MDTQQEAAEQAAQEAPVKPQTPQEQEQAILEETGKQLAENAPKPEPENPAEETTVDPFITAKAREIINGKWGNGQARKDALAAWFVKAVQDEVNRLMA